MRYLSEQKAEAFLRDFGFNVAESSYVSLESGLKRGIKKIGFPFVMKISGKKIVHKNKLNGVKLNIPTYSKAIDDFNELKKIRGVEGVLLQKKYNFDKEFLIGVKKTSDFGHVLLFGSGGIDVESKKDVVFRVLPLTKGEIKSAIKEAKISKNLLKSDGEAIENVIFKINHLVKNYPNILELDLNPLVISDKKSVILDARILFE